MLLCPWWSAGKLLDYLRQLARYYRVLFTGANAPEGDGPVLPADAAGTPPAADDAANVGEAAPKKART